MEINLELYRIFYVVAKNKHMTRASEELHISQPAISQQIKKLESLLGGTLFIRSNKGMELTEEGKMFYEYVKGALELIKNAENEFTSYKDLSKGTINIGCSTTLTKLVLIDAIKEFHNNYPNIDINITNELTSNLLLDLEKGKLDFVIYNEGEELNNNFDLSVIKTLKQGFIYNDKYFNDDIKSLKDLITKPLILQKTNSNSREFLDRYALSKSVVLIPKMEVVSQDLVREFTKLGLGIGFTFLDLVKEDNLKTLSINKDIPAIKVMIAKNKNISLTFASQKFVSYIK